VLRFMSLAEREDYIGGEGVEGVGGGAEAGEGEDGAGLLAEILGITGGVPEVLEGFDLVLELSSREEDGVAFFFFEVLLGFEREDFGEPVGDAGDDLADAGLGNLVFFGDLAGGEEFDEGEAVDFEVAGSGGQGAGGSGLGAEGCGDGHGKLLGKC
jgi:hypothetical protein